MVWISIFCYEDYFWSIWKGRIHEKPRPQHEVFIYQLLHKRLHLLRNSAVGDHRCWPTELKIWRFLTNLCALRSQHTTVVKTLMKTHTGIAAPPIVQIDWYASKLSYGSELHLVNLLSPSSQHIYSPRGLPFSFWPYHRIKNWSKDRWTLWVSTIPSRGNLHLERKSHASTCHQILYFFLGN